MDELTPEQEEAVAASVRSHPAHSDGAAQRTRRGALYPPIKEFGNESDMANAWLDMTMHGIQTLVVEIEAGGGASGGTA
jgi:hypothetical protein